MRLMSYRLRHHTPAPVTYTVSDRLQHQRAVEVTADEIVPTVEDWLAQLGVHSSPLVQDLGRTIRDGDWPAAHAIAESLSVDVSATA